jgi:16S rRNA (uracil1498-N3)-methyltransferase
MAEQRIATRLYLAADLAPGAELRLDPARAHFLRSVLRLEAGARLAAFNARDGEWLARIEGLGKGWCTIRIETPRRALGRTLGGHDRPRGRAYRERA